MTKSQTATPKPLRPRQLRADCEPSRLKFRTTDELPDLPGLVGQERAVEALDFGIDVRRQGYDIFAVGPAGSGKHTVVRSRLEASAARMPAPPDCCYVNNFQTPDKPRALMLPAGRGAALSVDMEKLVEELRHAIPAAFDSDDYRARHEAIQEEFKTKQEHAFEEFQKHATAKNIAVMRTPQGFALAPTIKGEVISPEVFQSWPKEERDRIRATIAELEKELQERMQLIPTWEGDRVAKLHELDTQVTTLAVGHIMAELMSRYADLPEVYAYLDAVKSDLLENAGDFLQRDPQSPFEMAVLSAPRPLEGSASFRRYRVNVIVDHAGSRGAPVVYQDMPKYPNLFGRIEHIAQFGALSTDFNLIKAGALHRANGGYLIVDARRVLNQPFVWEELKSALQSRELRIQGLQESLGLASTISLDPQPIPLDVKVVMVGEPMLYYLLSALDPDFQELFKVAADFEHDVQRSSSSTALYARLVANIARREKLKPLDAVGVARVIEQASRLANDARKLTLNVRSICDLLIESDQWATRNARNVIGGKDVQQAIGARERRLSRVKERSQEQIDRGIVKIDTQGEVVGQVNALSVMQLGEMMFGRPTRITARIRLGRGQLLDIEREVALGGPLHSKGVLILAGYLGEKFARQSPLAVSASLVFEQSYVGVDGDSASSAELYALLSAISGIPIKQSYAVTGSVNQRGEVQAIGGVNEKIEGFFDVCATRGLNGDQGVLIPTANIDHLMLRDDVVEAVRRSEFHVFALSHVDQGIALLTGQPAGRLRKDGSFTPGSVNEGVRVALGEFAEQARAFGAHDADKRSSR